jgi:hypothetical protein
VLIATIRCAASVRCGASADERRVVAGDEGGRVRPETLIQSLGRSGSPVGTQSADTSSTSGASLVESFAAGVRDLAIETLTAIYAGRLVSILVVHFIFLRGAAGEVGNAWGTHWPTGDLACRPRTFAQRIAHR